jgi:hypothetical protein
MRSDPWQPGRGRLTLADREEISLGLRERASFTAIASRLGKAVSTVSREVPATAAVPATGPGGRTNRPESVLVGRRRRS